MGDRIPNPCLITLQIQHGAFVRIIPTQVGKFDCTPGNLTTVNANIWPK